MNLVLWVLQIVLALFFLYSGILKTFRPLDEIAKMMTWVPTFPPSLVRFIGVIELLACVGLLLPGLTGILPWLTIWAGLGLAVVMVGAVALHGSRREYSATVMNIVLLVLTAFVAWGRWQIAAF